MVRTVLIAGLMAAVAMATPLMAQETMQQIPFPTQTQATFACSQANEGQLSCQVGTQCECKYFKKTREREAHWRWDCSMKRPSCPMVYTFVPGSTLPPGFALGRLPENFFDNAKDQQGRPQNNDPRRKND